MSDKYHHVLEAGDICVHTATDAGMTITCSGCFATVLRTSAGCGLTVEMLRNQSIVPLQTATTWPALTFIRALGLRSDGTNRQGIPMAAATWTFAIDTVEFASELGLITFNRAENCGYWPEELEATDPPLRISQVIAWLRDQGLPERMPPRAFWGYCKRRAQQQSPRGHGTNGNSRAQKTSNLAALSTPARHGNGNDAGNGSASSKSKGKQRARSPLFAPVSGSAAAGPSNSNHGLFNFTTPAQTDDGNRTRSSSGRAAPSTNPFAPSRNPFVPSKNPFAPVFGNPSFGQSGAVNNSSTPWAYTPPTSAFSTQQYRDPPTANPFGSASPSPPESPSGPRSSGRHAYSDRRNLNSPSRYAAATFGATNPSASNGESNVASAMAEFRVAHANYFSNPIPSTQLAFDSARTKVSRVLDPSRRPRTY